MNMSRLWTLVGVVAVLGILAGGYFLGVSPQLEAAEAADEQYEQTEVLNAGHRAELERLRALDASAIFAEVAEARETIPADHYQHRYAAQVQALAVAAGVRVDSIAYVDAIDAAAEAPSAPAAPEPDGDADAAADGGDAAVDATAAPVAAPGAAPAGMLAIGVTLSLSGSMDSLEAFTAALQAAPRITSIRTVTTEGELGGEYTLDVDGYVFVLPDA